MMTRRKRPFQSPQGDTIVKRLGSPWWLYALAMVVPYVVVTVFVTTPGQQVVQLLPTFCYGILLSVASGVVMCRSKNLRGAVGIGIIGCLLYEILVWTSGEQGGAAFAFPIFELMVLYRQTRLFKTISPSDENRTNLVWDTIGIVIAVLILLVNPLHKGVADWFTALLFLGLVLRLAAMWQMERLTNGLSGARGSAPLLFALVAFVALFGPKLLYAGFASVVVMGAVISIPFLYLLNAILPKKLLSGALQRHPTNSTLLRKQHPISHAAVPGSPAFHWALLALYGALLLVAVWFLWRRARTGFGMKAGEDEEQSDVAVVRNFLPTVNKFTFLVTNHPIRRQYQKWLAEKHKSGLTLQHWETPREFEGRVLQEAEGQGETHLEGDKTRAIFLREEYERARYRDDV